MKFTNSHDQHKVSGRGLDMVLCHSVLLTSYINELHKSEVPKLPQIIMALAPEVPYLHDTLDERFERPHKSVMGE